MELLQKLFNWKPERDNNYYFGLLLLVVGILTIVLYLLIDGFEPLAFLITFLICGWGFVLLWKSDNDFRFNLASERVQELEKELGYLKKTISPTTENCETISSEVVPADTSFEVSDGSSEIQPEAAGTVEALSPANETTDMLSAAQEEQENQDTL